jgi:hypothetical protein
VVVAGILSLANNSSKLGVRITSTVAVLSLSAGENEAVRLCPSTTSRSLDFVVTGGAESVTFGFRIDAVTQEGIESVR